MWLYNLFQTSEAEAKSLRGSWHDVRGFHTAVAYHPLAVRRRPNLRPLFLEDLAFVAECLHNLGL
jgi:uracil-DNA glycosylase